MLAVSGRITKSPLATREAAQVTNLPVLGLAELQDPELVRPLIGLPPIAEPAPAYDYSSEVQITLPAIGATGDLEPTWAREVAAQ